jgi:protein SCO1/2
MIVFGTLVMIVIGAAVVLLIVLNRPAQSTTNTGAAIIEGDAFDGITQVEPPRALPDFTLTDQRGEPFSLSDLRGKMALLFFGFTHCPDVCPLTLLEFKQVKSALGKQAEDVAFVFISIDGARDTPEVLAEYVGGFDESFIGLTGDDATLTRIGSDYNLYFARRANPSGSADDYIMDHTSSAFLVNRSGDLTAVYAYGTQSDVIAGDIQTRLANEQ